MANTATGMNESLAIGFESTFKTTPATANASQVPVTNPQISATANKFQSNALTGSPQPNQVVWGKSSVEGSFSIECNKESLMPVLKAVFGEPTTTGDVGFYEHTYTLGSMVPMFIEQSHPDVDTYFLWNGVYANSASLNFQSEGLMEASVNVIGARQTRSDASAINGTLTDLTAAPTFSYLLCRVKQGGSEVAWAQEVTLDINRNGYSEYALDQTNEVAFIGFAKAAITGRMTALFQDSASFQAALDAADNGTETSIEVYVPAGSGHGVVFTLPTIVFNRVSPTTSGTGVVKADFEFTAYARGSASSTAGAARSKYFSTIADLGSKTLLVEVDGGVAQTVTFAAGDDTPEEVVTAINANTTGCTASVERAAGEAGGVVVITSDTTGTTSSIKITATSTADIDLGFDNVLHSGLSNQSIVARLYNALAS